MIRIFFGNPGAGKTTLICKFLKRKQRTYNFTAANIEHSVPNAFSIPNISDLGQKTTPPGTYLAIDEAGIEYNNRAYKSMSKATISWFKKHRHFSTDVDVFSQSWEDVDVTIRRLAPELWYIKRIGPWTLARRVYKRVIIDENTHQIIDGYKFPSLLWLLFWPLQLGFIFDKKYMLTFRPFYYKYFDSWSREVLPYFECFGIPDQTDDAAVLPELDPAECSTSNLENLS